MFCAKKIDGWTGRLGERKSKKEGKKKSTGFSFGEGKLRKLFNETFLREWTESISDVILPGKITLCESSLFYQENNTNTLHWNTDLFIQENSEGKPLGKSELA